MKRFVRGVLGLLDWVLSGDDSGFPGVIHYLLYVVLSPFWLAWLVFTVISAWSGYDSRR